MTDRLIPIQSGLVLATVAFFACSPTSSDPSDARIIEGTGSSQGDGDLVIGDGDGDLVIGDGDGDLNGVGGGEGSVTPGTPTGVPGAFLGRPPEGCGSILPVTFRDFRGNSETGGHEDFELSKLYPAGGTWEGSDRYGDPAGSQGYMGVNEAGCEIVNPVLGTDSKPVFKHGRGYMRTLNPAERSPGVIQEVASCASDLNWNWDWTPPNSVKNALSFSDWYNTIEGTNAELEGYLELTSGGFESFEFFPLDGVGFGNTPGETHNYHFTTEAHVRFGYEGGESFTFQGDDDLWIFVNGRLAIDLGGVHEPMKHTIVFDDVATELGIVVTNPATQYSMDIFHAERQTTESNFKVETNITCFEPVDIIIK
jgi:fibro-slime domain-containing protein